MAKEVIMPKFGFTQETAEIVRWIRREGERVDQGDPLAEVTTDKVNMEVEAPAAGVLAGVRYKEGDVVPVTEVIAYILAPGEQLPAGAAPAPSPSVESATEAGDGDQRPHRLATPVAQQVARERGVDLTMVAGSGPGGRVMRADVENYLASAGGKVRATPAARRVARTEGINLTEVAGSGPHGRVQAEDVLRHLASKAGPQPPPPTIQPVGAPASGQPQVLPLSPTRRTIAERMQRSFQEAPHIYLETDVDASALEELHRRANARLAESASPTMKEAEQPLRPRVSITALLVRAAAWTLTRHPLLNSRLDGANLLLLPEINISVAVATDHGLIAPVVRQADRKSVSQISAELADLAERARQSRLLPDDVAGGTFTISNLGMFGVDRFTAIINPPQVAILAVGRIHRQFVPDEQDQPVLRPILPLTLGADHRVVDGADAARFLADLRECLEHPEIMVI
jgi:pyruvate dehydrogenase E2 component (dihydrolipoamide acetyltransferase)